MNSLHLPPAPHLCLMCQRNVLALAESNALQGRTTGTCWIWRRQVQPSTAFDLAHASTACEDTRAGLKALFGHAHVVYVYEQSAYLCEQCFERHCQSLQALLKGGDPIDPGTAEPVRNPGDSGESSTAPYPSDPEQHSQWSPSGDDQSAVAGETGNYVRSLIEIGKRRSDQS